MPPKKSTSTKSSKSKEKTQQSQDVDEFEDAKNDLAALQTNADSSARTSKEAKEFVKMYFDELIGTQQEDSFRFFKQVFQNQNRKDGATESYYYYCYARDAEFIAREYFKNEGTIQFWGEEKPHNKVSNLKDTKLKETFPERNKREQLERNNGRLSSIAFNQPKCIEFISDLLQKRSKKVEIWEKIDKKWTLVKRGSPGNAEELEDYLEQSDEIDDGCVLALVLTVTSNTPWVSYALYSAKDRTISVGEFGDNDSYTTFDTLLVNTGAKECYYPLDNTQTVHWNKIAEVLDANGVVHEKLEKKLFDASDKDAIMQKLLGADRHKTAFAQIDMNHCMQAACALTRKLNLADNVENESHFELKGHNLEKFMRLDSSAMKALNVMQSPTDASRNWSLYGILSTNCSTKMGARKLLQWLRQPLANKEEIESRQEFVDLFLQNSVVKAIIKDKILKQTPDLDILLRRLQRYRTTTSDLCKLYSFVSKLEDYKAQIQEESDGSSEILNNFIEFLQHASDDVSEFCNLVESIIDLDHLKEHREAIIKSEFTPELQEIKEALDELQEEAKEECNRLLAEHEIKSLELRNDEKTKTFYFFCKQAEWKNAKMDYKTISNTKSGVKFTTDALNDVNTSYSGKKLEYDAEQQHILHQAVQVVHSFLHVFSSIGEKLTELDIYCSFADFADNLQCCRPTILESTGTKNDQILIKRCRHPCLAIMSGFTPNDVEMKRGTSNFIIITGPNMSGKSTYSRMIGVAVLLAQIGCFVPAESAEITLRDSILARIGASDSQIRGISTFMSEMLEASAILKTATEKSLVIIDELGRGTSVSEGFGISYALSEYLIKTVRCFCTFATHFHELTSLASSYEGVENLSVKTIVQEGKLVFKYTIEKAACTNSLGVDCAELAGFPSEIIRKAKRKLAILEAANKEKPEEETEEPAPKKQKVNLDEKQQKFIHKFLASFCNCNFNEAQMAQENVERLRGFLAKISATPIKDYL